jgi:sterol desaturase/sphingolipid hydroxylase (fatty acid hydroxylase superfamily)
MLSILLTAIITFFVSGLFGYVVHRSLHQSWMGVLNRKHMTHHLVLYPPSDYFSDTYRHPGKDNTVLIFGLFSIPLILAPVILGLCGVLPLSLVVTSIVVMGLMGILHDYIHDAFHLKNHWFTKVPGLKGIFAYWNELHYLHHVDMQKNFGIFLFHWDHIFRTFWKK